MRILLPLILIIFLAACNDDDLSIFSGNVTEITSANNNFKWVYVEQENEGNEDETTIIFSVPPEMHEEIEVGDDITVYYDEYVGRNDSLPPQQFGVERIEFTGN
ncbi:hypothetical protein JCM19037_2973 [Geomicrobium sp. JCM 19037]|uniref:hypothetical protein n=1 Tax=Geomicrobium sp. JCM 19037 TaxID=1460634 RepID=UPI00045F2D84|nr:hypothetical protein [Geomicrobium sp. JCM 19037]GAK04547.1 hypothetical protein JCM19037_2973 [Geomicrobium sp. JCM 19037]